jgi:hypothetical protein
MSVDQLAWAFTAALGILAVSTGVAVSYLFSLSDHSVALPPAVPSVQARNDPGIGTDQPFTDEEPHP